MKEDPNQYAPLQGEYGSPQGGAKGPTRGGVQPRKTDSACCVALLKQCHKRSNATSLFWVWPTAGWPRLCRPRKASQHTADLDVTERAEHGIGLAQLLAGDLAAFQYDLAKRDLVALSGAAAGHVIGDRLGEVRKPDRLGSGLLRLVAVLPQPSDRVGDGLLPLAIPHH